MLETYINLTGTLNPEVLARFIDKNGYIINDNASFQPIGGPAVYSTFQSYQTNLFSLEDF